MDPRELLADRPIRSWDAFEKCGRRFFTEICSRYPHWTPPDRMRMEPALEALLHLHNYDRQMVDLYMTALKEAAAHDKTVPAPEQADVF
jgi:hypothetical protein